MASNEQRATPTQADPIQNVSVRVIALAHATNRNEDVHLVISLESTVLQLKERLQEILSQHPQPGAQRLIYQGRPLTNNDATLRQILRLEPPGAQPVSAHVLHLVIRDDQATSVPSTGRAQPTLNAPQIMDPARGLGHVPAAIPPGAIPINQPLGPENIAAIHNQAQNLHQQMLANQQHMLAQLRLQQQQQQTRNQHPGSASIPLPHMPLPNLPVHPHTPHVPRPQQSQVNGPPNGQFNNASSTAASAVNGPAVGPAPVMQGGMTMRVHETYGPNGEITRRVIHNGPVLPVHMNNIQRSSSAPGSAASFASPALATRISNGGNVSAMNNSNLPSQPQSQPHLPPHLHPHSHLHTQALPFIPNQLPNRAASSNYFGATGPAGNPLLFLLSSPSGPEALLIAPNHGLFTSQAPVTPSQNAEQNQPTVPTPRVDQHQTSESAQTAPTPRPEPGPEPRNPGQGQGQGQVALRRLQPPAQDPAQAQIVRRDGEDILALALQRGWLFLRLYMFIFVLSEAGTWRRYILLTIASLVCLLPRNNPFNDMFQVVRRHFDNLIGPPQPPAAPQEVRRPTQDGTVNTNGAATPSAEITDAQAQQQSRGNRTQMPTPAEHARRLLRENEQRNPNVIRETFVRIEQALALFLASLIPGVGERHVRAREEARRVMQEEEQRRRREENERAQQEVDEVETKTEDVQIEDSSRDDAQGAVSTGVEAGSSAPSADTGEGVRMRANHSDT